VKELVPESWQASDEQENGTLHKPSNWDIISAFHGSLKGFQAKSVEFTVYRPRLVFGCAAQYRHQARAPPLKRTRLSGTRPIACMAPWLHRLGFCAVS
jgi:hypothetical protein